MNKRKVILGILIVMAMAICGVFWSQTTSYVFADDTAVEDEINIEDAGTFEGCGYYEVEQTATLKAIMNPGYKFKAWIAVDDEGNETELSTSMEYTFVVENNITIKPTVERLEYNVSFADDLWLDESKTELKDFDYQISNQMQNNGKNYYNDQIQIEFSIKTDKYIDDLDINMLIDNPQTVTSVDEMNLNINITNDGIGEFKNAVITFNIKDSVIIDINYIYKYVLTIQSLNDDVAVKDIIQFVAISENAKVLDEYEYTYLVRADQQVTIKLSQGNSVYDFKFSQFQGQDPTEVKTKSYTLYEDSVFNVKYIKKDYTASFNTYLINVYGQRELIQNSFYNIDSVTLQAGQIIIFEYDENTRQITIIDPTYTETVYDYQTNLFGYKFVRFEINGEKFTNGTGAYVLSLTEPDNVEIELIFELIEYSLEIQLVDEYFADDVIYSINYNNDLNKLVAGTEVTLQATTSSYTINGWSNTNNPKYNGYADIADENAKSDIYTYTFKPTSDDNSESYIVYLDIDYSYLLIEYNLKSNSIVKNVDYDMVDIDTANKTIVFSDSENKVESKTITYVDEDVTADGTKIIISTLEMGDIEINDDQLTYSVNMISHTSINKITQDGVDTYKFNKYTYFGDLQVGVIDHIVLTEMEDEVSVSFNGNIYPNPEGYTGTILSFTTTKVYDDTKNAYEITYYKQIGENRTSILTMYLYMNGTEYDYVILRNIKYYYDSVNNKFILKNATINEPKSVQSTITKGETYSIQLNNLLSNSILVYFTKTTNDTNYSFINYTNKSGTSLWDFEDNGYNICILNSTTTNQLNASYRQLANNITLLINIEKAYKYDDIFFTIANDDGIIEGRGAIISAKDDEIITITLSAEISKGYAFDCYAFEGVNIGNTTTLQLTMDSSVYANKIININFVPIQYTININYIDNDNNIIEQNDLMGYLRLQGQEKASTIIVDISNEYILQAITTTGHYVSKAYIGTDAYRLNGLERDNLSTDLITEWYLNGNNFEQAIIDNAGEGTEVNLYIKIVKHTYSVKVYFDIPTNASAIIYPTLKINGVAKTLTSQTEEENGISVVKRFVEAEGYEYNSNVYFRLENFMMGTTIEKWCDEQGTNLLEYSLNYTKNQITSDIILKVILQYVPYNIEFVSLDEDGQTCQYGGAHTNNGATTFKLFETVAYTVDIGQGYVLKQTYYYNNEGIIGDNNVESGFVFNPANFKIQNGTTFKIYLVFGLKSVNLAISNVVYGKMYYFDGQEASTLATYTVSRMRGVTEDLLDNQTGYEFLTGDKIIMKISPISIGVVLNNIQLGEISIDFGVKSQYSLSVVEVKEDNVLVGLNYLLVLEFTPEIISGLSSENYVILQNVLMVKEFNATYTYNYIEYNFGIRLTRRYESGSSATANADTAMEMKYNPNDPSKSNPLGFGTNITFGCTWEGVNTGEGSKFVIDGYLIAGIEQVPNSLNDRFEFNSLDLWESVALTSYLQNPTQYLSNYPEILIVLKLRPKITLYNYTSYSEEEGYVYDKAVYNGQNQGLISGTDVVIGGDFDIKIKYSKANFEGDYPVDAGIYNVAITAIINENIDPIVFDEKVTYSIARAKGGVVLKTISSSNPLTKVYGESDDMYLQKMENDIVFTGGFAGDTINVEITSIQFMSRDVTDNTLCDIVVKGISILNELGKEATNYELSSGSVVTFSRVGKINCRSLEIRGFTINNKVYDGTENVYVDVSNIICDSPLAGDSVEILYDNLKFYINDYSIGTSREVLLDWETALIGADSNNYQIVYSKTYVDVHPYEITYELEGYGTFKVVDVNKTAQIPIGSRLIVKAFEKGSAEYRAIYGLIEGEMQQGEKLKDCFRITIQLNSVNLKIPEGLFVYIPKVNKTTKVAQVYQDNAHENLEYIQQDKYTIVKVVEGDALLGVVASTTYLPLWAIILIVIGALVLIAILVIIFIIVRRKTKRKYSMYNRI